MVLSLKAWKSRSLPGLPRTEHLFTCTRKKPPRIARGGFFWFRARGPVFPCYYRLRLRPVLPPCSTLKVKVPDECGAKLGDRVFPYCCGGCVHVFLAR